MRFFKALAPVDLARLLLVMVPCVPGLTFLLAGLVRDPHWRARDAAPSLMSAEYARAAAQASQLYLVGAVVLMVGTLCMAVILWRIIRQARAIEAEKAAAEQESAA